MSEIPFKVTPPPQGSALLRENVFESERAEVSDEDEELLLRRQPTMLRRGKKLIAPSNDNEKKYTVVFDLDETVVYARDGPLYARFYLKDLLRALKKDFEVIVWTAGEREYAKSVLEEINEDHIIQHLIYRHRRWYKSEDYTKDLTRLGRDINYTVIIENTPDCVRVNPENGIIVEDFEVLQESDDENEELSDNDNRNSKAEEMVNTNVSNEKGNQNSIETTKEKNIVQQSDKELATSSNQKHSEVRNQEEAQNVKENLKNNMSAVNNIEEIECSLYTQDNGVNNDDNNNNLSSEQEEKEIPQRRRRQLKDRTLFILRELLLNLAQSHKTVPEFLSTCKLLSKQTVVGSDGKDIPIYHLGTRRRRKDAGESKKILKENKDRVNTKCKNSITEHILKATAQFAEAIKKANDKERKSEE